MGRPIRIEYPCALYHITSRGNEKKKIFASDEDRLKFLQIIEDYHDRYGILIHSYVLMDNHYHLILETPQGNLLKVMHGINSGYTGYFNRRYKRTGHLFQGRYKAILVDKDNYLIELSRYVHLNPVRAKAVERPEQYRWSSYSGYIGKGERIAWIEYAWVLSQLSNDNKKAMRGFKEFVEEGMRKEVPPPLKDIHGQIVLGGGKFIEKIKKMFTGQELSRDIAERKRFKTLPDPDKIIKEVAAAFGVDEDMIEGKGQKNNTARNAAIYFVQRYTGLKNEETGKIFGGIHYSAVSKASWRLKQAMADDKRIEKLIKTVESRIKA